MNLARIVAFLDDALGAGLNAAFIYGSVARRQARQGSDLDCFVITENDVSLMRRAAMRTGFAALQRSLGYRPDPQYPIELFSVAACASALGGPELRRWLDAAAVTGAVEARVAEDDRMEVIRALLDKRVILRASPALDQFTAHAHALLEEQGHRRLAVLQAIGLIPADGPAL